MREIICGIGGFVGSNLKKYFRDQKREVVVLPVEMLMDINSMHALFKENEPYHLYYLAAYGNLHGQNDVQEIYRAMVLKLLNVLQATENTQCEAFITFGSSSEYGNRHEAMVETMMVEPETFYGAAKAGATHLALAWAKQKGTPVISVRPSSITGVGEQPMHLIPTLIRSCVFQEAIPLIPGPMHDYINVYDICTAVDLLAQKAKENNGQIFNIGTGVQLTNQEIKEMIEEISGERANINKMMKINRLHTSEVWIVDSTKLKKLGWKPKYTLYKTLKEMIRAV